MSENGVVTTDPKEAVVANDIDAAERFLIKSGLAMVRGFGEEHKEAPVFHHFAGGLYCRELHMPADSIVTSYIHRYENPFIVSMGTLFVLSDSREWVRIDAPHFGITRAGTRRILYNLTDTIWTTFHKNPCEDKDIEKIEREIFILPNEEFLSEYIK